MIPLRDENPSSSTPVVTRALIGLNVLVFLLEWLAGPQRDGLLLAFGMIPARVTLAATGHLPVSDAALTLVTSMFLHGGWLHLIGNMWYLWIFGDNIEDRLGRARFLAFYLGAGVLAALLHTAVHPLSTVPTVGASGAIAGVLGAYAFTFPRARVLTLVPIVFFLQVMALPARLVLGLWFVVQCFSGTASLGFNTAAGGTAWWAHIGGFVFGIAVMALTGARRASGAWIAD